MVSERAPSIDARLPRREAVASGSAPEERCLVAKVRSITDHSLARTLDAARCPSIGFRINRKEATLIPVRRRKTSREGVRPIPDYTHV